MQNLNEAMRKKASGSNSYKKQVLRIDMTPMVDLGFLLITFFIFSAELSKPAVSDLYMPKDGPPTILGERDALSIILLEDKEFIYYRGSFDVAVNNNAVMFSSGKIGADTRQAIQQVQLAYRQEKHSADNLMLLIKPTDLSSYGEVIGILDEVLINDVKKYAIMELSADEKKYMDNL